MSQLNEAAIRNVVSEVLAQMQSKGTLAMPSYKLAPASTVSLTTPSKRWRSA